MSDAGAIPEWLGERLDGVLRAAGSTAPDISQIAPLPGHAGLGFSFDATLPSLERRRLVVRTIADGVPPAGPADVVRQARIMQALGRLGFPTPAMLWFGNDDPAFGRPFFIGAFVDGRQIPEDWREHRPHHRRLAERAIETMARLHDIDWRAVEGAWGDPVPLVHELERLHKLLDRPTINPDYVGRAFELGRRLAASIPGDLEIGCVHGDMHAGNMIFGDDEVLAVVDWEIAFVGPTLLDIGWVASFADPLAAIPDHADRPKRWVLSSDEMIDVYRAARREPVPMGQIDWFRAFSHYRFGVITLFNEMLHRRGKRHDPSWSEVVRSAPQMMQRGLDLLA
ncbi:MAG: phosphotransferase family protein [Caulobacteraceae bacterium]|nr:phosphotransferase family protein [Caulobacteraceae bacterium]